MPPSHSIASKMKTSLLEFKSLRRARRVVVLTFAAFCGMGMANSGAQAGFLDDLVDAFTGGQRVMEAPPAQRPTANRAKRVVRHHATSLSYLPKPAKPTHVGKRVAHAGGRVNVAAASNGLGANPSAKLVAGANNGLCYAAQPQSPDPGRSDALLHDVTLRQGDTVMTDQGVRVFEGGGGCPHKNSEFLALADARDVSRTKRGALLAIEKAVKTPLATGEVGSFLVNGRNESTPKQP